MTVNKPLEDHTIQLDIETEQLKLATARLMEKAKKIIAINKQKEKDDEPLGSDKRDKSLTIIKADGTVQRIRDKRGILIR